MTTRDMLHRLVFYYGENETDRYTAGSNEVVQTLAIKRRHRYERAIDYLMTRLERPRRSLPPHGDARCDNARCGCNA